MFMKLSVIQMRVGHDKEENLRHAAVLVAQAAREGADMAVLPEMFVCPYENQAFLSNGEPAGGRIWKVLSEMAERNGLYLVGGSFPEQADGRLYNSSFVFDSQGRQIARHRKVHLFDIDVEGGQYFRESDTFTAGNDITVFDTPFGRMGLCICFDLRFPELARIMALEGAKVLLIPAAFNMTTGPLHWELLFRSRAIDDQVFTVGCAPARDENGPYVSYGNSLIADPWGKILVRAGAEEEVLMTELDLTETERVRMQLPLMSARRTDLYQLCRGERDQSKF